MSTMRIFAVVGQFARFSIIGGLATLVHVLILLALVETLSYDPVFSTPLAFCVAVFVSYFGNFKWTFAAKDRAIARFPKFVVIQFVGLGMNTAIMYAVYDLARLDYRIGVAFAVVVVPVVVFVLQRIWTFSGRTSIVTGS
jgi:putative flippase GtrA